MAYKPPVAVYDACVLYPFHLRNLLVQCAVDRLVDARWTDTIHEEWIRSLVADDASLSEAKLRRTRNLMNRFLPDANVAGYQRHIDRIRLPDPDDRHVVAAGIAANASFIITWNAPDSPARELAKHGLSRKSPDTLLTDPYSARPDVVLAATANARRNLSRSASSASDFLDALDRQRVHRFVRAMRGHISDL